MTGCTGATLRLYSSLLIAVFLMKDICFSGYYIVAVFCIVSLLRASVADPGRLPESPKIPLTGTVLTDL